MNCRRTTPRTTRWPPDGRLKPWRIFMKRALLAIGAAAVLAVSVPLSADAQHGPGGGGGKRGPAATGALGGGGGFAGRGGPSGGHAVMGGAPRGGFGGGGFAASAGSPAISVRPGMAGPVGSRIAGPRFAGPRVGGPGVVARGVVSSGSGSSRIAANGHRVWQGGDWRHRHRHFRSGAFALGFSAPYYDDYATPYADDDDDCYRIRRVQTPRGWVARRAWVCD
jgi:hypothetical protein